ncbi:MAG TPA: hypothetical protein VGD79_01175 [Thermoanaerobaculia bacterium]
MLLLVHVAAAAFAGDLSLVLTAEPSRTLPGIPVSLSVTAINDGDVDVALPAGLLLRVVPSSGEPFLAQWGFRQERRYSSAAFPETPGTVPAHGRKTFLFPAADIERAAGWFADPRIHIPGSYRLELLLADRLPEEELAHAAAVQLESVVPVRIASTQAVLTVDTPDGEDAVLWNRLQELARKRGAATWSVLFWNLEERASFAHDALQNHPQSPYAAYAAPYENSIPDDRRIDAVNRVLAAQPSTPNREHLRLFVAQSQAAVAGDAEAAVPPNQRLAVEMTERARATFAALERESADPAIRSASRAARAKLPTAQELQQRMR